MVRKSNRNKNSSVGDNMVSAETSGNASSSINNVITDVVGSWKGRGRPSKAVGAASRTSSVVLPPENTNKGSCTLNSPGGGVKAKASKSVPVDGIRKAVVIAKETAKQIDSIVESNASENEEVNDEQKQRLLESRIPAQRRALLEYELKKVKINIQ